ncbi:MAG: PEP-CTERM sorting domain-containing protein [Armatimonadetes bacterium]|nr:PEP-CTERM sorting domain-containing protein [Armatimonadota bacterium]
MKLAFAVASSVALAATSQALVTTMTFNGVDMGEVVGLSGHLNGQVWSASLDFFSSSIYGNINTFCVDLDHFISVGQSWDAYVVDSSTLSGGYKSAANIVGNAFFQANTSDKACGLQLAVWEAVYDDGATLDLNNGNLIAGGESASALAWAQTYYAAYRTLDAHAIYFKPVADDGQGQMTAVPEPASMLGLGALALGIAKRRRK